MQTAMSVSVLRGIFSRGSSVHCKQREEKMRVGVVIVRDGRVRNTPGGIKVPACEIRTASLTTMCAVCAWAGKVSYVLARILN